MTPEIERTLDLALETLEWMVANDDTNEGDEPVERLGGQSWNEYNAYWIDGLNRARAAITAIKQALAAPVISAGPITPAMQTGPTPEQKEQMVHAMQSAYPAAPVQEPVAWYRDENGIRIYYESKYWDDATPLYTTPPAAQRQWVGLTDEEVDHTEWIPKRGSQITYDIGWLDNMRIFARALEAKLKEKNT